MQPVLVLESGVFFPEDETRAAGAWNLGLAPADPVFNGSYGCGAFAADDGVHALERCFRHPRHQ